MTKRSIYFVLFALLVVLLLVVPFIDGYLFKQEFINTIIAANHYSMDKNNPFQMKVMDYKLGWLSSNAKTQLIVTDEEINEYFPDGLVIENHISHGPFVRDLINGNYTVALASVKGELYLPKKIQQLLLGTRQNEPFIETKTMAWFGNEWAQLTSIQPVTIPDIGVISFQDSLGKFKIMVNNNQINAFDLQGAVGAILFQSEHPMVPQISIEPIHIEQTATRQLYGIWGINYKMDLPSLTIKWTDGSSMNISQMDVTSIQGLDNRGLYNGSMHLSIKKLEIPWRIISSISPLTVAFSINHLNPQGLEKLQNHIETYASKQQYSKDDIKQLVLLIENTITPTSNFNMDVLLKTTLGIFLLKTNMTYSKNDQAATIPGNLIHNVNMKTQLQISEALLKKIVALSMNNIEAYGAVHKEKSEYQAEVNGKETLMQKQTAALLQKGKLSLQDALQILELANRHISVEGFSMQLNKSISPDVAQELIEAYKVQYASMASDKVNRQRVTNPTPTVTIEDKAQKIIDSFVQEGYLLKKNNEYIATIIYSGGTVKINNKIVDMKPGAISPVLPPASAQ